MYHPTQDARAHITVVLSRAPLHALLSMHACMTFALLLHAALLLLREPRALSTLINNREMKMMGQL